MSLLPTSALRFAPTLRLAKFMNCHPPLMMRPLFFYHDRSTSSSSPSASQRMTWSACSVAILHSSSFIFKQWISRTLRTIYVCCWCCNERSQKVDHNMVIQDTPSLERLLVVDQQGPTRINVISVLKLKWWATRLSNTTTFRYNSRLIPLLLNINVISSFEDVCSSVIQRSFTQTLGTVKVLALESVIPNLDQVFSCLRCFLCLKKLYIEVMFLSC